MLTGGLDLPEPFQPREGWPDGHHALGGTWRDAGWRAVGRLFRVLLPGCVVSVALLGALLDPLSSTAGALFLGVLSGGVVALVNPDFPAQAPARRAMVLAAFWGVVAAPFAVGIVALGSGGAAVVLVILVLTPLWVTYRVLDEARKWTENDLTLLRPVLPDLPTSALLDLWTETDCVVSGSSTPGERERAVEFRALLLEELAGRDPSGVDAWVRHPGSRPDAHICDDRKG